MASGPGGRLELPAGPGALDLWSAPLDQAPPHAALAAMLSTDEQRRADRFQRPQDRDRFISARTFLRLLLGRYLDVDPASVPLRTGPNGKPEVEHGELSFNLAHARDLAVCVIGTAGVAVGVDVERLEPIRDAPGVERMILSSVERALMDRLPAPRRLRRLYETWTCKEALLKAAGTGLDRPLDTIELTFAQDEAPGIVAASVDGTASPFSLRTFEPAPGHIGAIAASCPVVRLSHHSWRWS